MVTWTLGALISVLVIGGAGLQWAIQRNGPAVLSVIDRIAGGDGGAQQLAMIATGDHSAQKLIVWGPRRRDTKTRLPVLVFAHGGSWRSGDPVDYGFIGRAFVPRGFVVVLVGYRLVDDSGSEGTWPAMLEDTARAMRWTRDEIADYGGDPERIVLAGHSAGAYNVMMTAMDERWLEQEGVSATAISGVIGLSGPYDFYPFDSDSTVAAFGKAEEPLATQVFTHLRSDAPPLLLIHGEKDDTVAPRHSRDLAAQIEAKGGTVRLKTYPQMEHNDPLISLAAPWRDRRDVAERIAGFAKEVSGR